MDVTAVEKATRQAMDYVRAGRPFFLEARTYRFRAHSMYDAELYRDKGEVEKWKQHDPITTSMARLKDRGLLSDAAQADLEAVVAAEIAEAVAVAETGSWEPIEDLAKDVYTPIENGSRSSNERSRCS
jgi:TPP-dependent pyruvate/acetoin dehydrogenase alpha subunit